MEKSSTITDAKYQKIMDQIVGISALFNGIQISVPISPGNKHYDELMKQVETGTLTIAPADE